MKIETFIILFFAGVILSSCKKEPESYREKLLESITWGQPSVLNRPANIGYWSETTCTSGRSIRFDEKGDYSNHDYCSDIIINGKWSWTIPDNEIKLETYFEGIRQRTYIMAIVELSDSLLHTREREAGEPADSHFELKYRPRSSSK